MRNQSVAVSDGIKVMSLQNNSSSIFSLTQTQQKKKPMPMPMASKLLKLLETQPILSANWVDSMRASSPPRSSFSDHDNSWTASHPSALEKFDRIVKASKGKQIVVFLDYDGTLSPIVKNPDSAYMSNEMRSAVKAVAKHFPTAIVSGRGKDKVYDFVKLKELYYAGSHGMDIQGPANTQGKESILFQPDDEFLVMIDQVYWKLVDKTKLIHGVKVEHNKFCVSVHFRCVDDKKWPELAERVKTVLNEYPKLKMTNGRMVLEIKPTIKWNKGKALKFLLKTLGYENSKDVVPIYIGDDRTDEDAFKVLRKRKQGLGILVSKSPKETNAAYTLRDPSEVMKFLERLVEWKQASRHGYTLPCDQDELKFTLKYYL